VKTIIAGGRNIFNRMTLLEAIRACPWEITEIVSGGASGVDAMAEEYAVKRGIDLAVIKAEWDTHGKSAGPIRNRKMAEISESLLAIWDGESRGTANMISIARSHNLMVYVHRIDR
jgi:hypothetical protein